jgi:hypothetical protein
VTLAEDLIAAAQDELERACTLPWRQLAEVTPWGDTFEGITPAGRDACFERAYLWEGEKFSDIRVEVTVFEPTAYEQGVRLTRSIPRDPFDIRSI